MIRSLADASNKEFKKEIFLTIPDSEEISLNGTTLRFGEKRLLQKKQIIEFRKKTGMVFQSFNLFSHRTVIENIIEGPVTVLKKKKADAFKEGMALLEKVGLAEKANQYPRQLSGGQQQRVAIENGNILEKGSFSSLCQSGNERINKFLISLQ